MKRIVFWVFLFLFLVFLTPAVAVSMAQQLVFVDVRACDVDKDGDIDPLDLISAVSLAPPEEFAVAGKWSELIMSDTPPFGASTWHGFIDADLVSVENWCGHFGPAIYRNPVKVLNALANQIIVWWSRTAREEYQDIYMVFSWSDKENWTDEEITQAINSPPPIFIDPSGDGKTTSLDIAIISKFMPLPKGIEEDTSLIARAMNSNPRFVNVSQYVLADSVDNLPSRDKLATKWGKIKT